MTRLSPACHVATPQQHAGASVTGSVRTIVRLMAGYAGQARQAKTMNWHHLQPPASQHLFLDPIVPA